MRALLEFRVRGTPIAQPRPRAFVRGGHARVYDDPKHPNVGWRQAVAMAARQALQGAPPITVPVVVSALFLLPRPAKLVWKRQPMPRVGHTSRPDIDNLLKSVMDALSPKRGAGAWLDDSQVVGFLDVRKAYCEAGWADGKLVQEPAGALVRVCAADVYRDSQWEVIAGWKGDLPW